MRTIKRLFENWIQNITKKIAFKCFVNVYRVSHYTPDYTQAIAEEMRQNNDPLGRGIKPNMKNWKIIQGVPPCSSPRRILSMRIIKWMMTNLFKLDRYITDIETSFRMNRKKDDSKNSGIENSTNFATILATLTTEKGNCRPKSFTQPRKTLSFCIVCTR
jgi:hypothetical protein